jgi:SAM-dependent methyltransferase
VTERSEEIWTDRVFLRQVQYRTDVSLAARRRAHDATLLAADATALPLRDATADLTLAMHMLYHVPDPDLAVRELRRVTRRGGRVIVGLNGDDHLHELRDIIVRALRDIGHDAPSAVYQRLSLSQGEAMLRRAFSSVTRHDFSSALLLPGPEPAIGYVRSTFVTTFLADPGPLVSAVTSRLRNDGGATLRVTTHSGCLVRT